MHYTREQTFGNTFSTTLEENFALESPATKPRSLSATIPFTCRSFISITY
ncbi:MAG: hypothetical protein P4M11_15850 [Candidatus Pacebacteria bacterium]|nr:hypothetical protein [Candidatus Paceibacterota bacterium]